ncbi:MAG: hypothetical protein HQ570_03800 [Candidatus Omnitrophica bacterium]|nr:hypothetical protein [Candidatus Omnitrophota bacterium]
MKKKALFFTLIAILTTSLILISWELSAQEYHQDDSKVKEEPSGEIKQLYNELQSKINQLKKKTDFPPHLKAIQEEIKEISLELKGIQPKVEPETAENRVEIKLDSTSRALIEKKRELQTELYNADAPLQPLKDDLARLLREKEKLEAEYFLIPIEIPIFAETISELKGPIIIIEGEVELRHSDDINITLTLERSVAATAFCEIYLDDTFITRKRWKIGPKEDFTATIAAANIAVSQEGLNNLAIILNTGYHDDDLMIKSPSFEKNPLAIFNESKIAARNLISGSFKLRPEGIPAEEQPENSSDQMNKDQLDEEISDNLAEIGS